MSSHGKPPPVLVGLVLASLIAALGACTRAEGDAARPVEIRVGLSEDGLAWEPTSFTVQRDTAVTISATNSGVFGSHDLVVLGAVFATEAGATESMASNPDLVVGEIGLLDPGLSDSVTVTFADPGTYQFICTVTGHFSSGMRGTITVVE